MSIPNLFNGTKMPDLRHRDYVADFLQFETDQLPCHASSYDNYDPTPSPSHPSVLPNARAVVGQALSPIETHQPQSQLQPLPLSQPQLQLQHFGRLVEQDVNNKAPPTSHPVVPRMFGQADNDRASDSYQVGPRMVLARQHIKREAPHAFQQVSPRTTRQHVNSCAFKTYQLGPGMVGQHMGQFRASRPLTNHAYSPPVYPPGSGNQEYNHLHTLLASHPQAFNGPQAFRTFEYPLAVLPFNKFHLINHIHNNIQNIVGPNVQSVSHNVSSKMEERPFTLFPKLPPEIRMMIWKFCFQKPRLARLGMNIPPGESQANREARLVCLECHPVHHYRLGTMAPVAVCLNKNIDILYLEIGLPGFGYNPRFGKWNKVPVQADMQRLGFRQPKVVREQVLDSLIKSAAPWLSNVTRLALPLYVAFRMFREHADSIGAAMWKLLDVMFPVLQELILVVGDRLPGRSHTMDDLKFIYYYSIHQSLDRPEKNWVDKIFDGERVNPKSDNTARTFRFTFAKLRRTAK